MKVLGTMEEARWDHEASKTYMLNITNLYIGTFSQVKLYFFFSQQLQVLS